MDGKSLDLTEEKANRLKEILPEAFTEGKIDWEKLKATLGEDIEFKNERYVLNWAGKSDAFRVLQSPTTSTLVPDKEESVNFDDTENIFIEGENLEVLKILQKSYFGKIKMIYIDPPYNTGNDKFIYPDKFSETKEEYLSRIGDKDESGYMTHEGLFRTNSKDSGHYHSNWLSMMYPRLFLARNLLRDDGVIFVSIDDNEVHNLRLMMNEIFGEENFVGKLIWRKKAGGGQADDFFVREHEYVLVYQKSQEFIWKDEEIPDDISNYNKEDERGKFNLVKLAKWGNTARRVDRPSMYFPLVDPDGNENYPVAPDSGEGRWRVGKQTMDDLIKNDLVHWEKRDNTYVPYEKIYYDGNKVKINKFRSILYDIAQTGDGSNVLTNLFEKKDIFENPKPVELLTSFMKENLETDDIILDFFAGSSTTAHAVLDLNEEDGENRKFICIQLPEATEEKSEAFSEGYKTIADIGKERIRRVIKKIKAEEKSKLDVDDTAGKQDLGFRVFKLQKSNFKIWRSDVTNEEELVTQLEKFTDPVDKKSKIENILYELLLKSGIPLTAKIVEENNYYLANDGEIALMLEKVDENIIMKVISEKPQKVITLDRLFKDNDQLKTNTALQMKDAEIDFRVV
jgi:adenine-specific DNA-methyltransferase